MTYLDKTQLWEDLDDGIPELELSQIEWAAWMRDLAEIQWRDLMNQDPPTHWVLLYPVTFSFEYIFIKIIYLHLKYCGLFLYSKNSSSSLIISSQMFQVFAQWYHSKHSLWYYNA